jgi:hypothetical protein
MVLMWLCGMCSEMDAIRKRASAFREQVAKQQQVIWQQVSLFCSLLFIYLFISDMSAL